MRPGGHLADAAYALLGTLSGQHDVLSPHVPYNVVQRWEGLLLVPRPRKGWPHHLSYGPVRSWMKLLFPCPREEGK